MKAVMNLLVTLSEILEFFNDALEVSDGCRGSAIPYRVDPQYAIPFGQSRHDVFFAQRIAVPVVAKADDVFTFEHIDPCQPSLSGRG